MLLLRDYLRPRPPPPPWLPLPPPLLKPPPLLRPELKLLPLLRWLDEDDDELLREVDTFWLRVADELRLLPERAPVRVLELTLVDEPTLEARRDDTPVEGVVTTEPGRPVLTALPGRVGRRLPVVAAVAEPVPYRPRPVVVMPLPGRELPGRTAVPAALDPRLPGRVPATA